MSSAPPSMPAAEVLGVFFSRLGLPVDAARLSTTVAQLQTHYEPGRLVEWTRLLVARSDLSQLVPVRLRWRRFDRRQLPALVWHEGAWGIAEAQDDEHILLSAPGMAAHVVPAEALAPALVLWFRQRRAPAGETQVRQAARLLWREILAHRGWIPKVMLATVVINVLGVASSLFAMQVYDRVVPTLAYATLTTLSVGMLFVVLIDALLKSGRSRIVDSLSSSVDCRVSQQVFEHLLQVEVDKLPRSVGTVAAQVNGLEGVRQFFSSSIVFGLVDFPFALLFLAFIATIGGVVVVPYALMLALALLTGWSTHRALAKLVKQQVSRSNERQGVLVEAIRGAESIRSANAGWGFAREWQAITQGISAANSRQKLLNSRLTVTVGVLSTLAYVSAIVIGVWQVEAGAMTTGAIVACSILGGRVLGPASQGAQMLAQWEHVSQGLNMVDRLLAIPAERHPDQVLASPALEGESVRLQADKLQYSYAGSPLLQVQGPAELAFRSGDRVLLVGPIGSGKSTLLKLLAGLYRPSAGRVRIEGVDLSQIDPQVLAAHVGYLPQDVHLFKGSLRENLVVSGVASDEQIAQIAQALGIDDIAAGHPMGMDMPISEGGMGLSGGQRQLVALGRLLVAQPRVWLLDEPTASLDAEAEARVWKTIEAMVRPEDILIVSTHKWRMAAQMATRVIVMRRGEVTRDDHPKQVFPRLFGGQEQGSAMQRPLAGPGLGEMAGGMRIV